MKINKDTQKSLIVALRRDFFDEIVKALFIPPGVIDRAMCQHENYVRPDGVVLNDPDMGTLLIKICNLHPFDSDDAGVFYSIYQIGRVLKVGILIHDSVMNHSFKADAGGIWSAKPAVLTARGQNILLEWEFDEPDLYESWIPQEGYVLGVRHMHFRLMAILMHYGIVSAEESSAGIFFN